MFSGGRDSTLAAIRLANSRMNPILVTVSSEHLNGISAVEKRLAELKRYLPHDTLWIRLSDSGLIAPNLNLATKTCLPCFLGYVSLGVIIARKYNTPYLAFGFTKYQSDWPEQTPYAIKKLRKVLTQFGISLEIPVYDISTKDGSIKELCALDMTTSALEQKCSRQLTNEELPLFVLEKAIDEWMDALHLAITSNIELDPIFITSRNINDLE